MRSYGHGWNGAHKSTTNGATLTAPKVQMPEHMNATVSPLTFDDPRVDVLAAGMTRGWSHLSESSRNTLRLGASDLLGRLDAVKAPRPACTTQSRVVEETAERLRGMVRTPDYDTSIEGAAKANETKENLQTKLLAAFHGAGPNGFTDEQAAEAAGLVDSCWWKRCGELRAQGRIAYTGDKRKGRKGVDRKVSAFVQEEES